MFRVERKLVVLDFDVEARPLHWIAGDYVSKEITAIAAKVIGSDRSPKVFALRTASADERIEMLEWFRGLYDEADMVTGHYIRGYDLPLINGMMSELLLPSLNDKLSHDTKLDLMKRSGLSGSQENIGVMLGLHHPKVQMDQAKWRAANRLESGGIVLTKQRVIGDVEQHIELRAKLLELGYLRSPRVWHSHGTFSPQYTP